MFRTRLDVDDEVELTTEEAEAPGNASAAQPVASEPTDGLIGDVQHEEVQVVTLWRGDDPDAPGNRKAKRKTSRKKAGAQKKTAAKKTTRKKTAARKR